MRYVIAGWILLLAGCVYTSAPKVLAPNLTPVCFDAVRLYMRPDSVHVPFQEVAYLKVSGGALARGSNMVNSLRNRAGELGANGVIYHPYLDRNPDFLGSSGNALAILIPSDTARAQRDCVVAHQRWIDSVENLKSKGGVP